jgi:hypothetical protein
MSEFIATADGSSSETDIITPLLSSGSTRLNRADALTTTKDNTNLAATISIYKTDTKRGRGWRKFS